MASTKLKVHAHAHGLLIYVIQLVLSFAQRVHGGGVSLINWSPTGDWLFVGHVNSLCRVWETRQWTCEKWTNLAGRCKVHRYIHVHIWICNTLISYVHIHVPVPVNRHPVGALKETIWYLLWKMIHLYTIYR